MDFMKQEKARRKDFRLDHNTDKKMSQKKAMAAKNKRKE